MKYEIPCLLLVGSTLVPYWHLTFLHVGFYFAVTWAVIHCRKQRNLSENQFAECKEYKPTLAYKCECRQKSLTLPNVGNICIHWILWDIYVQMICQKLWQISVRVGITRSTVIVFAQKKLLCTIGCHPNNYIIEDLGHSCVTPLKFCFRFFAAFLFCPQEAEN